MRRRLIIAGVVVMGVGVALSLIPADGYCIDGVDYSYCGATYLWPIGVPILVLGVIVLIAGLRRSSD